MSYIFLKKYLLLAGLAFLPSLAWSQFVVPPAFRNAAEPQWNLTGTAKLTAATAPGLDAAGAGWLRLTENTRGQNGSALYTGATFSADQGVIVDFDYVMWMKTPSSNQAADGLSFYLYDASQGMAGSLAGGGLGYCGGQGGYLGVGFDAFGNFSTALSCTTAGASGQQPNAIVVRGPQSQRNAYVASANVPAMNNPNATQRPVDRSARIMLTPTGNAASPFLVSVLDGPSGAPVPVITNQLFPYAAPAQLSIGFSGSTGGDTQIHEVRLNRVAAPADIGIQTMLTSPASRRRGEDVSYVISVSNNNLRHSSLSAQIQDPSSAPHINDRMAELSDIRWTCTATGNGTTCPAAAGSGDFSNLGQYTLGLSGALQFSVQGKLAASAACGASICNTASIAFDDSVGYTDEDLSNNRSTSAAYVVDCVDPPIITPPKKTRPTHPHRRCLEPGPAVAVPAEPGPVHGAPRTQRLSARENSPQPTQGQQQSPLKKSVGFANGRPGSNNAPPVEKPTE